MNGSILSRGRLKVPVLLIVTVSLLALPVVGWAYYKSSIVGEKINHDMAKSTNSASDSLSSLAPLGLSIGDFDYSKVTDDDVISGKYKGRKLHDVKNLHVRPTQAKVRKSICQILEPFHEMEVCRAMRPEAIRMGGQREPNARPRGAG